MSSKYQNNMENKTARYQITLYGCDDSTPFEMDLTDVEYELLQRASDLSVSTSNYACMPTMKVRLAEVEQDEQTVEGESEA